MLLMLLRSSPDVFFSLSLSPRAEIECLVSNCVSRKYVIKERGLKMLTACRNIRLTNHRLSNIGFDRRYLLLSLLSSLIDKLTLSRRYSTRILKVFLTSIFYVSLLCTKIFHILRFANMSHITNASALFHNVRIMQ